MVPAGGERAGDGGEVAGSPAGSSAVHGARAGRWSPWRFDGRLGRTEFVLFAVAWSALLGFGTSLVATVLLASLAVVAAPSTVNMVAGVLLVAALLVYLAGLASYGVRRLHDMGRSGRWLLLGLVPVAGLLVTFPLLVVPGSDGANAYGERETTTLVPVRFEPSTVAPRGPEPALRPEEAFEEGRRFAERQRERP